MGLGKTRGMGFEKPGLYTSHHGFIPAAERPIGYISWPP